MFIDVHSHLNDERLKENIPEIIENAKKNGIEKIICVGCDMESTVLAVEIAKKFAEVYACIGFHPEYAEEFCDSNLEVLRKLAKEQKVVAIGEIGLDYHYEPYDKTRQKNMFIKQLKLANELLLPIEIHCRDATGDMMEILKENKNYIKNGGIMHCYSGSLETLKEIENLGLKISLGGILTFKNARATVELAEKMPLEMLTFETDCPYLAPHPFRSTTNEPKNVLYVAQKFAEIRNLNIEIIENIAFENTIKTFPKMF